MHNVNKFEISQYPYNQCILFQLFDFICLISEVLVDESSLLVIDLDSRCEGIDNKEGKNMIFYFKKKNGINALSVN